MRKFFDIQMYAEENIIAVADLTPGISIDFVSRISSNINELQRVLGITEMESMGEGTTIKVYKMEVANSPEQVGEGETIGLTKVTRVLDRTLELTLKKYRKNTTAEAIQKHGREMAINQTDEKLISKIQKEIKQDFFTVLLAGTGTAAGNGIQATLANAWGKLNTFHEDEGVTAVHFLNPEDVGDYLGNAQITTQTAFGLTYIENFLGLGTVVVSPRVTKGKTISTAKENLHGAYVPTTTGDVGRTFGLRSDKSGLIGVTHQVIGSNATVDTLAFSGVLFYPERIDGVFIGTIGNGTGA